MSTEQQSAGARGAPRVFVTYAQDSAGHKELVRRFCTFLRVEAGVDVELDQWAGEGRHDWSLWATRQLEEADFVLVIASPAYKRRADGQAPHDEGRGAQFEAAIIRNNLTRNLPRETRRVLPVVLPGRSENDIPTFLCAHSTTRYLISEFTMDGVRPLLRAFEGVAEYARPPLGPYTGAGARTEAREIRRAVLLTTALRPVRRGPDLRFGGADLDGTHYGNSIVHRCSTFCSDARSAVEFDLGRRYRAFHSVVGVLDDAEEGEQIGQFQVFLDGRAQPPARATLGAPVTIRLDVTGVLRLRLVAYRPDTVASPLMVGAMLAGGHSGRTPALAWGDPTLEE
jgi:hypothetical protein